LERLAGKVFKEGTKTADIDVGPQKTMVVAKNLQVWDKSVDKLCASSDMHCISQIACISKKKPPSTRLGGFSERSENQAVSP
jgi:hypothetical protein